MKGHGTLHGEKNQSDSSDKNIVGCWSNRINEAEDLSVEIYIPHTGKRPDICLSKLSEYIDLVLETTLYLLHIVFFFNLGHLTHKIM